MCCLALHPMKPATAAGRTREVLRGTQHPPRQPGSHLQAPPSSSPPISALCMGPPSPPGGTGLQGGKQPRSHTLGFPGRGAVPALRPRKEGQALQESQPAGKGAGEKSRPRSHWESEEQPTGRAPKRDKSQGDLSAPRGGLILHSSAAANRKAGAHPTPATVPHGTIHVAWPGLLHASPS